MNILQWKNGDRTFFSLEVDDRLLLLHVSVRIAKRGLFAISVLTILSRVLIDNNGRWLPGLPQEKMTNSIA